MESGRKATMNNEVRKVKVRPLKDKDEYSSVTSKRTVLTSSPNVILKRSITALKGRGSKNSAGQVLVFLGKVVVLEALRRVSQGTCRPIWWGLQGLTVFQVPPFSWLQRWTPFRVVAHATKSFSKPMLFLSIATAVRSACKDSRQENVVVVPSTLSAVDLALIDPRTGEAKEEEILFADHQVLPVEALKRQLDMNGVVLPERIDDDEVERFGVAADGDMTKFVTNMKKTVKWRENYHFLSQSDLRLWEHLVFWHLQDAFGRPTLIIRLGFAYSTLAPSERPSFAQAIVSQVEYGLRNMVINDDARLTVVMDCQGTSAIGFPINLMRSCTTLVQENYPTRLAALFVINLPSIVRVVANAVLQVVKASTQEKVHMEGDNYMNSLATYLGGIFNVPIVLGGKCSCELCEDIRVHKAKGEMSLVAQKTHVELEQLGDQDLAMEERALCARRSTYESYSRSLRVVIMSLFLLWILVAMIPGFNDTYMPPT